MNQMMDSNLDFVWFSYDNTKRNKSIKRTCHFLLWFKPHLEY